jgi:hypothetical protein
VPLKTARERRTDPFSAHNNNKQKKGSKYTHAGGQRSLHPFMNSTPIAHSGGTVIRMTRSFPLSLTQMSSESARSFEGLTHMPIGVLNDHSVRGGRPAEA